ncbi:hypothetical protein ACOBQX_02740 [Actinokineospora sp. G85]|uniref:hypothetical protein n=1 Tax=Actinokineospora sp. G85 TaxID=3406626 RepID=UPI003C77E52C
MSDEARRAAVAALIRLAGSTDYRGRADAGRSLATFADMPEAKGPLLALVLDAGDTFVTHVTAEALLRRQDSAGLGIVAAALATADPNHAEWVHTAVLDVFGVFSRDRDAAVQECEALARDSDEQTRCGVDQLTATLAGINPIFQPAPNDSATRLAPPPRTST